MDSEAKAVRALSRYGDSVRRICTLHLHHRADAEDVFQDVFLKYILTAPPFQSDAHEKAWLLRVAINRCKDVKKGFFRRNIASLEDMELPAPDAMDDGGRALRQAVCALPPPYKNAIYLHYYEGYTAVEIAAMLGKRVNTIYTWLSRGKSRLKESLGGDFLA